MLLSIAAVFAFLLLILSFSREIENSKETKRHVNLVQDTLQEELRQIKAESISTPGGK
jgi:hypothetical protein